jgi:rhodanese-related sulfurtransferase
LEIFLKDIVQFLTNHWILSSTFGLLLIAFIANEIRSQLSHSGVSATDAVLLINHQGALVVDIRTPAAYADGHIVGAINIPLADLDKKLNTLHKQAEKPIILVCNMGHDAEKAHAILKQKGMSALILKGGIQAWRAASLPLTKKS